MTIVWCKKRRCKHNNNEGRCALKEITILLSECVTFEDRFFSKS